MQGIGGTLSQVLGEQSSEMKRFAQFQAAINAALAVTQVLSDETIQSTPVKMALAGTISAMAGAQIAAIQAQNFAEGGPVRGPGTSRSDDIPAMLSDGE